MHGMVSALPASGGACAHCDATTKEGGLWQQHLAGLQVLSSYEWDVPALHTCMCAWWCVLLCVAWHVPLACMQWRIGDVLTPAEQH